MYKVSVIARFRHMAIGSAGSSFFGSCMNAAPPASPATRLGAWCFSFCRCPSGPCSLLFQAIPRLSSHTFSQRRSLFFRMPFLMSRMIPFFMQQVCARCIRVQVIYRFLQECECGRAGEAASGNFRQFHVRTRQNKYHINTIYCRWRIPLQKRALPAGALLLYDVYAGPTAPSFL